MSNLKVVRCEACGKMAVILKDSACPTKCCGEAMTVLSANTTDAAQEKHVPCVTREGNRITVTVGSVEHPMVEAHYIEWIAVQTKQGNQRKPLKPGEKPEACFAICDGDEVEAVYEHCNLHGLWKK